MESNLNSLDANIITDDGVQVIKDFYKKANRIYVAKTANSRLAVLEYEGKYYVSERRLIISRHNYGVLVYGYSKKDEILKEATPEQVSQIFGEESIAKEKYGNKIDCAIEGVFPLGFSARDLKRIQESDEVSIEDEISRLSKQNEITEGEVNRNPLKILLDKVKEKMGMKGRN